MAKSSRKQRKQAIRSQNKAKNKEIAKQKRNQERVRMAIKRGLSKDIPVKGTGSLLERINETTNFILENKNINKSNALSGSIRIAMADTLGVPPSEYSPKPGESNKYFEISSEWKGDLPSLINYVTFKDTSALSDTGKRYLERVINSDWGSPERYHNYKVESSNQAYKTLLANEALDFDLTNNETILLRDIMSDSDMWHIVGDKYGLGTKNYLSNDAKEDFLELRQDVQDFISEGKLTGKLREGHLNQLKQMIRNQENYNTILNYVNDKIKEYNK